MATRPSKKLRAGEKTAVAPGASGHGSCDSRQSAESRGSVAPRQTAPGSQAVNAVPFASRRPRMSLGHGCRGGIGTDCRSSPRTRRTRAASRMRTPSSSRTASRMGCSCSQSSFFSSVTCAKVPPPRSPPFAGCGESGVRGQESNSTCRSSPRRNSATRRKCVRFSDTVSRISFAGAASTTRTPRGRTDRCTSAAISAASASQKTGRSRNDQR